MIEDRRRSISLKDKIVTFTGPPDSGKSNLVRYLLTLPEYRNHLIYDPLFAFDPEEYSVIRPPDRSTKWRRYEDGNRDLNEAVDRFVLDVPPQLRPDYFVVDEAGRLLPNNKPEGAAMGELNDFNAHLGISLWIVGQRFQQLNSDLKSKATHHFVMGYKGQNDKNYLRNYHEDAPAALDEVKAEHGTYGFVHIGPNGALNKIPPVPKVGEKAEL